MHDVLLRFVHISDTHYCPPDYQAPYSRFSPRTGTAALIEQLKALPFQPDFILHTGDVAYDPYPNIYDEIAEVFGDLKIPVRYVPGNHDHSATLQTALMKRDTVSIPLHHTEIVNGVRMIYLDTNSNRPPAGEVSEAQIEWLRGVLDVDRTMPIVVAVHHPLIKTHTSAWFDTFMMTANGDAVHDVLQTATERIRGVFFGHVHQDITFYRDGILYAAAASSWTQFHTRPDQDMETISDDPADPGYSLVTITTEGAFIQRYHYRVD